MSDIHTTYSSEILEQMSDGIFMLSEDGTITIFNVAAGNILEIEPADVIGKPFLECFSSQPDDDSCDTNKLFLSELREHIGSPRKVIPFCRPDGKTIQLAATSSRVETDSNTSLTVIFAEATALTISEDSEQEMHQVMEEMKDSQDSLTNSIQQLKTKQRVGIVFAVLLFIGALVGVWYSDLIDIELFSSNIQKPQTAVQTITVVARPVSSEVSLTGVLEPLEVINVSAPFAGAVAEKNFTWGQIDPLFSDGRDPFSHIDIHGRIRIGT